MINRIVEEVEIGKTYLGTVRKIMDFGAFVEVLPGTDGSSTSPNWRITASNPWPTKCRKEIRSS